jgi:hypothetical protein
MSEATNARQFVYRGDHEETTVLGVTFTQGEPTEVADPKAAKKLAGNSDFTEFVDGAEIEASQDGDQGTEVAVKPAAKSAAKSAQKKAGKK